MIAAHCTKDMSVSKMKVFVYRHAIDGGADEHKCAETLKVDEKFEHPDYDERADNDIALLRLSRVHPPPPPAKNRRRLPLETVRLRPPPDPPSPRAHDDVSCLARLCLLPQPVGCAGSITMPLLDDGSYSGADTTATVAGWGDTSEDGSLPDVLLSVDLKLLTNAKCGKSYGYEGRLTDSMICAIGDLKGGEDACQGDSGGPLFVQQARAFCPTPPPRHSTRKYPRAFEVDPPLPPRPLLTPTPRTPPRLGREGWTSSSALSRGAAAARGSASQASTRACPLSNPG